MLFMDMMQYRFYIGVYTPREAPVGLPTFSKETSMLQAEDYTTNMSASV